MELFPKALKRALSTYPSGDPAKYRRALPVLLFWLALWQIGAWAVGSHILLAGPLQVVKALASLLPTAAFWRSVATSFGKIGLGFLTAFFTGIFVGWLAFRFSFLQVLLAPAITFMNSVPLASFIILALIWTGSEDLAVLTSYLVVFPMLYVQTIAGLKSTDRKLLEMAAVFQIRGWPKLIGLYWPALLPYLMSGCRTALGMSWKAGIAAEVIGVPSHTIGEQLYLSKVYLSTAELFAWTFTIILISLLSERVFLLLLGRRPLLPKGRHDRHSRVSVQGNGHSWLSAQDLDKSFGDLQVLRKVCFHASAGVPCCIMGPSGSGKTTFFRVLLGLEQPVCILVGLKKLIRAKPVKGYIILDRTRKVEFNHIYFISAHILPFEGGFQLAPQANGDDGCLSVCVVDHVSKWRLFTIMLSALFLRKRGRTGIRTYKCREAFMHVDRPMASHADGEDCGVWSDLQAQCIEKKLRVIV